MAQLNATQTIQEQFERSFAGSRAQHERARKVIPGGITHDGRRMNPFPLYVTRADGGHKWDIDGHELVDFAMGHGSLILGHNRPEVVEAISRQLHLGTHYGASHEGEIAWAERIVAMVPSAEQVKFTGSGTESTMLAVRIARAATGKPTVIKFEGHFHGWNEYLLKGEKSPFADQRVVGIPDAVLDTVAVLPANDADVLEERLALGDVAAVFIEPSGGSWSKVPVADGFLKRVRELATEHGAILVFDEVITGFRWAPGGAQERYGILPDLTTFAKIVAGGLPGGAVTGPRTIMDVLAYKDDPTWNMTKKVRHPGTYNANPVTAAAGLACLTLCADPAVQAHCDDLGRRARIGLNEVLERRDARGFAWGESSAFHLALGETCTNRSDLDIRVPAGVGSEALKMSGSSTLGTSLNQGMLLEGIDLFNSGGMMSTAHTVADIDHLVAAFDSVIERMSAEGLGV
ncbi:MAG: aminotransferase, Class III pyridoxal-phosphate dependent [uncultured Thermomicrobiales bacterium]|uniref:Aminotransferase, Class III pyridoxal-phosphate dependent n=1 Tax=uncultured Thermomicrobiales bacterium TaxID=1645740 RepID=A0A6J4UD60_9BACT|nr:MAG: aminotransferase, Class III pyridoxal-phosphate dependent [uncultured Thermomicrobiales bacterium]